MLGYCVCLGDFCRVGACLDEGASEYCSTVNKTLLGSTAAYPCVTATDRRFVPRQVHGHGCKRYVVFNVYRFNERLK